jgi:hypothetical protein
MLTHKQKVRLARKMRTPPEIHQQLQAILKTQQSLANRAIEIDDLSPSGKYSKKSKQTFANTYNSWIDLVRALVGDHTGNAPTQLAIAVCQGMLHSHFNFPGVKYVFSLVHEMGHQTARFTYSRVVQDQLSERLHTTLYTLATKKRLSQQKISQLWEEFQQTNEQFVNLARKFELIEEIYATYTAMTVLPPEVRTKGVYVGGQRRCKMAGGFFSSKHFKWLSASEEGSVTCHTSP